MQYGERLSRIERIAWSNIGMTVNENDAVDVQSYLRNMARLLRSRGISGVHPFIKIATLFDVSSQLNTVRRDTAVILANLEYPLVKSMVEAYLLSSIIGGEVNNIFDPLMNVFERGGVIDMQPGELVIDNKWTVVLQNWIERY